MLCALDEELLFAGDQRTGTLGAVHPLILLIGEQAQRRKINPAFRLHEFFDRVMGLTRIRRPDVKHKMPFHAPRCRVQVHIIVGDLREDHLKQLPVPALGLLALAPLLLFPFPEGRQAVLRQNFSLPGGGVHQEPENVPPGPPVFCRKETSEVVLRRPAHRLDDVQDELRLRQKNPRLLRNDLHEFLLFLVGGSTDLIPYGPQKKTIFLLRRRAPSCGVGGSIFCQNRRDLRGVRDL